MGAAQGQTPRGAAGRTARRMSDCRSCDAAKRKLVNSIAARLGVDPETLHRALHAMPMTESIALKRVNKVTTGLERELGGASILQKWAHTRITALDDRKPVDVLVEGHVEPLERLHAVLEAGVYS